MQMKELKEFTEEDARKFEKDTAKERDDRYREMREFEKEMKRERRNEILNVTNTFYPRKKKTSKAKPKRKVCKCKK